MGLSSRLKRHTSRHSQAQRPAKVIPAHIARNSDIVRIVKRRKVTITPSTPMPLPFIVSPVRLEGLPSGILEDGRGIRVPLGRCDHRRRLAAGVRKMVGPSSSSLFFNLLSSPRVVSCSETGGAPVTTGIRPAPDTQIPRQTQSSAPASHTPHFREIPAQNTLVVELRRLGGKTVCGRKRIGASPVLAPQDRKRRLCCVLRRRAPPGHPQTVSKLSSEPEGVGEGEGAPLLQGV